MVSSIRMQMKPLLPYYISLLVNIGGVWGVNCTSAHSCHHFRRQEATWRLPLTNSSTNKALLSFNSSVSSPFPFLDKLIPYILSIRPHLWKACGGEQRLEPQWKPSKGFISIFYEIGFSKIMSYSRPWVRKGTILRRFPSGCSIFTIHPNVILIWHTDWKKNTTLFFTLL